MVEIEVLGKNVLVEETLKKKSKLYLSGEDNKSNEDLVYDASRKVLSVGEEVTSIRPNTEPIIAHWAINEPLYTEIVEGKIGDEKMVRHSIFKCDVVVGTKPIQV